MCCLFKGKKVFEVYEMGRRVRYHKTCDKERLWYMHMWVSGLSIMSIAQRTERSPTTVRRWLRRLFEDHRAILLAPELWLKRLPLLCGLHEGKCFVGNVICDYMNESRSSTKTNNAL